MTKNPLPQVRLTAHNYSLGHVLIRDDDNFDLTAPYQRGSVWSTDQRRSLIQSLLMGVPTGAVVASLLIDPMGPQYRVVDGKQRIEAVRAFTNDAVEIPAWWLRPEQLGDAALVGSDAAVVYSQFSSAGRRHFEMATPFPFLEFDGREESLGRDGDGKWQHTERTEAELLAAEAELFGLINFAGVAQTAADQTKAAGVAATANEFA